MTIPKISIIIPVYNSAIFLPKCLNSILKQTLNEIEIICIDDCSTDNSVAIIESFITNDKRIKLIKQPFNQRQGAARNKGLSIAIGEYIWFIDSDDWLNDKTACQNIYNIAKNHNVDIVEIDVDFLLNGLSKNEYNAVLTKYQGKLTDTAKTNFVYENWYTYYPWVNIFKRDFLISNNLYFPEGVSYEDAITVIWKLLASSIYVNPTAYYQYNMRAGSTTTTIKVDIYKDIIKVLANMKDLIRMQNLREFNQFMVLHVIYLLFWLDSSRLAFLACNNKQRQELATNVCNFLKNLNLDNNQLQEHYSQYNFFNNKKIKSTNFAKAINMLTKNKDNLTIVKKAFNFNNIDISLYQLKQFIKRQFLHR